AVPGSGVPIRAIVELFESGDPVPAPLDDDEGVESDRLGAHADLYGNHLGIGNVDDGCRDGDETDVPDGQRVAAGVRRLDEEEAERIGQRGLEPLAVLVDEGDFGVWDGRAGGDVDYGA